jgi:carbon monoxide dehydrogenase subunit G
MQIWLPAVAGRYEVYVRLLEEDEPYRRRFVGEVDGPAGSIRGDAAFALQTTGDKTALEYEAQGTVSGLLARLSERFVEGAARGLVNQGLVKLNQGLNR